MSNRLFEVEQRERDCPPNRSFVAGRIVELRATGLLALSRKYQGYREAWHVFGDVLAELAA